MPTYDYACHACNHAFEEIQSIRADALVSCPVCGEPALRRVLYPVHIFARGEPSTLAQQADRNTTAMGHYELQEKRHEQATAAERAGRKPRPKAERPFWRPHSDKVDTDLAKLAPKVTVEKGKIVNSEPLSEKAMDYIMTGTK